MSNKEPLWKKIARFRIKAKKAALGTDRRALNEATDIIESLRAELEREREESSNLKKGLRELASIVRIHSKATNNNFAWAEMEYAEMLLSTHQQGDSDE